MESSIKIISWAKKCLLAKGYTVNNPPETIQTTPWSSVTRFSTSDGGIYLKQMPPTLSLEPVIMQLLRDQFHANIPIVIAANKDLNCFLMNDCGIPLGEYLKTNFNPDLILQAVKIYTNIQYEASKNIDTFLELGVPDWRLNRLPSLYNQLISEEEMLKADGITADELNILHELHPKVSSMCERLSSYQIPETLDHCDFQDNNILIENETNNLTIIDWGETVITHPFFSLGTFLYVVMQRYVIKETDDVYITLQNYCFENYYHDISKNNLFNALSLAKKLWPVYAALGFHRLVTSSNPKEFKAYSGRLTGYFKDFIKTTIE